MIDSENRRDLEKERVALSRSLAERCGPALISHLDGPKRRQIAIYKKHLDVVPIDRGVRLKEEPHKQVLCEELVGSQDVDPRAFPARIRVQFQALQRVLGGELRRNLAARRRSPQYEVCIEVAAELDARFYRLILPRVVPEIETDLAVPEILLEPLELLDPR